MRNKKRNGLVVFGCLFASLLFADPVVSPFSAGEFGEWKVHEFDKLKPTEYELVAEDGKTVLHALSTKGASGLFFRQDIELKKTPNLQWSWKVTKGLDGVDEQTKAGDDYAARVYVLFKTKWAQIKPNTLVYVWSSDPEAPESYCSPYTDKAVIVPLDRGPKLHDQWRSHRRDVRADIKTHFGVQVDKILAVAIMTDADNSGQIAEAWYGDVDFR